MRLKSPVQVARYLVIAAVVAGTAVACAPRGTVYYDSGYNDHHRWDRREEIAYEQWEAERNLQHARFELRAAEQQNAYWAWRHRHPNQ
ncbi:MAG: hypothetical protein ABI338_05845 [Gemmatimonadaceae bacterium]